MNSIPIVTVDDLASNAFQKSSGKIDLKLSKKAGNGLTLSDDGLAYSASGGTSQFQRLLLGRLGDMRNIRNVVVEDIEVYLNLQDLGSDGKYLYVGATAPVEMRVSIFEHADSDNYGVDGGVNYTQSFNNNYWGSDTKRLHISYNLNGVNKAILLSRASFNGVYYIWADILTTPINSDGSDDGSGGTISFAGKVYEELYVKATYDLSLVVLGGYDSDLGGYDYYLTQIGPDGLSQPLFSFPYEVNQQPVIMKYNYSASLLAIIYNNGSKLKVIDSNLNSVDFDTGKTDQRFAIDIYPDPNSTDMLIAVAFGNGDVVDIYRYNVDNRVITKDDWFGVDFNVFQQGSNYYHIMALKVISATRIGFSLFLAMPSNEYISKIFVVNTGNGEVVEEIAINDANVYSGVENHNWIIDNDQSTNMVHVYELTETGVSSILEYQLSSPGFPALLKTVDRFSNEIADGYPGVVFNNWDNTDFTILTPYSDEGVAKLHVQKATTVQALDSYTNFIGFGEVRVTSPAMIAAMGRNLQPVVIDLTIVD